jgi:hypothetical protein
MEKAEILEVGDVVYSKRHRVRVSVEDINGEALTCVWFYSENKLPRETENKSGLDFKF